MFIARQTGVRGRDHDWLYSTRLDHDWLDNWTDDEIAVSTDRGLGRRASGPVFLTGRSVRTPMTEVTEAIDVPVAPETVWEVLTDLDAYPQWNTLLSISGRLSVGETLSVRLSMPGLPTVPLAPEITAVEPERALRWRSQLFGVRAEHAFLLEPQVEGGTRFVQTEQFQGRVAGPVVTRLERRIRRGFEQMNVGLRRQAVALSEERTAEQ